MAQPAATTILTVGASTDEGIKSFFVATLDNGSVRIGQNEGNHFDVPRGHAWWQRVFEASSYLEVSDLYNELKEALE